MCNPNTLKSLLELVYSDYPAEYYAFFIQSDCGSNWQGFCNDKQGNTRKSVNLISYPVFADVLKDVTNDGDDKLDVVVYGPCTSQALEAGYEISPYVDYMVASEEHMLEEKDNGSEYVLRYLESTWNLKNNTYMTPEEFATSIVDFYTPCDFPLYALYLYMIFVRDGEFGPFVNKLSEIITKFMNKRRNPEYHLVGFQTTLSAINLSKTHEVVQAIDELSSLLMLWKDDPAVKSALKEARSNVREYGKLYVKNLKFRFLRRNFLMLPIEKYAQDCFIDAYHFTELVYNAVENQDIKDACNDLMEKINEAVIANKIIPDDNSYGFTIYFPNDGESYNDYLWGDVLPAKYEELQFSQNSLWEEFLKSYLYR